jgi:hypothetical protein
MANVQEQNFANHAKFTPSYHFVLAPLVIVVVVWSGYRAIKVPGADTAMALIAAIVLLLLFTHVRTFPLKLQDRIIRLEEQLRLMRLLPDDLQPRIGEFTPSQLVALRFASDGELPDLARRVLNEKLAERKDIKQQVSSWRADHFRI